MKEKTKQSANNKLAGKMLIAMVLGIVAGIVFMMIRESCGADSEIWKQINSLLFQDITASGAESYAGVFCR